MSYRWPNHMPQRMMLAAFDVHNSGLQQIQGGQQMTQMSNFAFYFMLNGFNLLASLNLLEKILETRPLARGLVVHRPNPLGFG